MKNETLTPQESLDLISSMIRQAKGNIKDNSFYLVLWGWAVAIVNFIIYLLLAFTDISNSKANLAWLILIPVMLVHIIHGYKETKSARIITPIGTIIDWLWITYSITIFGIISFGQFINFQISPVILIITALPTLVTGKSLKFMPLIIGGILFWLFGIVAFLVPYKVQYLISTVAYIVGYLVPSYLLKSIKED